MSCQATSNVSTHHEFNSEQSTRDVLRALENIDHEEQQLRRKRYIPERLLRLRAVLDVAVILEPLRMASSGYNGAYPRTCMYNRLAHWQLSISKNVNDGLSQNSQTSGKYRG